MKKKNLKKLNEFIKYRKKELTKHFKKDGFDLRYEFIYEDAIHQILGESIYFKLANLLKPKNATLGMDINGELIFRRMDDKASKKTKT